MRLRHAMAAAVLAASAGLTAGVAQAQGSAGFASNQPMFNEHMHTFEIRTRPSDQDDNPTGFGKPGGVYRLTGDTWAPVMGDRPTRDLWGVGPRVSARLEAHGIRTVSDLARADPDLLAAEFGPRMGPWYGQLGRGEGTTEVTDTPWVARGHSREETFQQDLTERADIEAAIRKLAAQVAEDIRAEGRPVVRVTLKVRYKPFLTKTYGRKIPVTDRLEAIEATALALAEKIEPDRPVRLLGVHAEMTMPEDAREGHTPTRGGW